MIFAEILIIIVSELEILKHLYYNLQKYVSRSSR